jgi:hypothetical protein
VAFLLKARIVKPAETAVARQWLSNRHARNNRTVGSDVFCAVSNRVRVESLETAVRSVGGWCEMATSHRAEERPLLEAALRQHSEERWSVCDSDL